MDKTLKTVCGLLESSHNMRRSAAAITLAELAPKDADVVTALGTVLETANQTLTVYLLEALDRIGSPAAVPYVMPLLDADDMGTKLRAVNIVAKGGRKVLPQVLERFEKAPPRERPMLIDLLARIHTRDAFQAILDALFAPDFDLIRETCEAVHRHVRDATAKTREAHHKQVAEFLKKPKVQARERVITSCLLLLGHIGRPEARQLLLGYADPTRSPYVRRHALMALKSLELTDAAAKAVLGKVSAYVDDADEGIARQALDVMSRLPLSETSVSAWVKLLKSLRMKKRKL